MDFKKKYIKYKSKYYNLRDLIKDFSEKNQIKETNEKNIFQIPKKVCEVSQYFMEDDFEVSNWLINNVRDLDSEYKREIYEKPFVFELEIDGKKKYLCTSLGLIYLELQTGKYESDHEDDSYKIYYDDTNKKYLLINYQNDDVKEKFYYRLKKLLEIVDIGKILKLVNPESKILYNKKDKIEPINDNKENKCYQLEESILN